MDAHCSKQAELQAPGLSACALLLQDLWAQSIQAGWSEGFAGLSHSLLADAEENRRWVGWGGKEIRLLATLLTPGTDLVKVWGQWPSLSTVGNRGIIASKWDSLHFPPVFCSVWQETFLLAPYLLSCACSKSTSTLPAVKGWIWLENVSQKSVDSCYVL